MHVQHEEEGLRPFVFVGQSRIRIGGCGRMWKIKSSQSCAATNLGSAQELTSLSGHTFSDAQFGGQSRHISSSHQYSWRCVHPPFPVDPAHRVPFRDAGRWTGASQSAALKEIVQGRAYGKRREPNPYVVKTSRRGGPFRLGTPRWWVRTPRGGLRSQIPNRF